MPGYSGSMSTDDEKEIENFKNRFDYSNQLNIIIFLLVLILGNMIICKLFKK